MAFQSSLLKVTETPSEKTVYLNFVKGKNVILGIFVVILLIVSIVAFFPNPKVSGDFSEIDLGAKIGLLAIAWIGFLALYFFFYYPLSIKIIKKPDGSFEVDKRDWFFYHKRYRLNSSQNPRMIARRRRMVGATVFIPTVYQPIIRYSENGVEQEISFIFTAGYFMKGIGLRGVLKKENIEEIARELNLPLTVEE